MDIDFVVLWVDGNDLAWRKEKAKYQGKVLDDSNSENRFRDWGLMPYWFRAVEKFAPWVRTIHFVTCGHVPAFLNLDAPKLHHVRHEDYMPAEALPTFSSHALEMNLHRIPGLAEHFVYFNDDMFLLRPMPETAFFRDGLPSTYGGEVPLELSGKIEIWQHAIVNNLGVINKHFSKKEQVAKYGKKYSDKSYRWQDNIRTKAIEKLFPNYFYGFKNLHAPGAYTKSTFKAVWEAEPELLRSTTLHRFRSADDVNQWVCLWWQVASGQFTPYNTSSTVNTISTDTIQTLCAVITGQRYDMLCLNDGNVSTEFEDLKERLVRAFETILPEKCSFEK
jgi:hypothetical protein